MRHQCCRAHVPRVRSAFHMVSLRTFDRLDAAANAKINLRCILYIHYQWWSSCSDLTNTLRLRSHEGRRGSAMKLPRINVAPVPRHLVFRTMGRRHRKLSSYYTFGRLYCGVASYTTKIMQLLYSAPAPYERAHLMPHVTILNI